MVDPISGGAAASISSGAGVAGPSGVAGPGPANPADTAQFAEAMQQPAMPPAPDHVPGTQGSMLEGLDKVSANLRAMQGDLQNATTNMGEVGDLLRTQFQVAQLTMTQTMVGQVGSKTSQGTQQLLKGQ